MLPGILDDGRLDIRELSILSLVPLNLNLYVLQYGQVETLCRSRKLSSIHVVVAAVAGRKQQGSGEGERVKNEVTNRSRQAFFTPYISVR